MTSCALILLAAEFILLGVANSILEKAVYQQLSVGLPEYGEELRRFSKPWFYNAVAFASMPVSFLLYAFYRCRKPEQVKPISATPLRSFLLLFLPAVFDIFQGVMSSVTTLFVGVSVDKMLRGATIVFTALISVVRFRRRYNAYVWVGIVVICLSLFLVGLAAVLNSGSQQFTVSRGTTAAIIALKILSLAGYGFKLVIEEEAVTKRGIHHVLAVALEGTWSTLLCVLICLPLFQFVKGPEGVGLREDTLDTFEMIRNNTTIAILLVAVFIVYCFYNNVSMNLTGKVSAVTRLVIDCGKTMALWIVQLIIFYSFGTNPKLAVFRFIGEPWKEFSWLQFIGFALNVIGMFIYNGSLKVRCCSQYPEDIDEFTRLSTVPLEEFGEK